MNGAAPSSPAAAASSPGAGAPPVSAAASLEAPPAAAPSPLATWSALGAVYVVWGSTYLGIRVMVDTIPPLLGTAARFLLAVALIVMWLAVRRQLGRLRVPRRELLAAAGIGVVLLVGGTGLVGLAEQEVPSGLAALVVAAVPLMVVVLRRLTGERVSAATIVSVIVGFAGLGLLLLPGRGAAADVEPWGIALILLAALFWTLGSFWSSRVPLPRDGIASTTLQMLAGGIVCVALAGASGEFGRFERADVSAASAWAVIYLTIFGSIVAFSAYAWLLQNVRMSTVATYAYVNPVVAVFLGWAILDEKVTVTMLAAAAVVIGSVAVTVRRESSPDAEADRTP